MSLQKRVFANLLLFSLPLTLALVWSLFGPVFGEDQNAPSEIQRPEAVLQVSHRGVVNAVVFSPDGRWLASGAKDGTIKIWEINTGRLLRTLYGHGSAVNALAVSPDGHTLASGGGNTYDVRYRKLFLQGGLTVGEKQDATVRLWDVRTGKQTWLQEGHELAVMALAFSRDGHRLTSASSDAIKLWDLDSGKELSSVVVFSPPKITKAGLILHNVSPISIGKDPAVKRWTAIFNDSSVEIAMSPGGDLVATAQPDRDFRLFDIQHSRELSHLDAKAKPGVHAAVAFSPDGQLLAYVKDNGSVTVRAIASGNELWHSQPFARPVLSFNAEGKTLFIEATSTGGRVISMWSANHGSQVRQFALNEERTSRLLSCSADGNYLASVPLGDDGVVLRETRQGKLVRSFQGAVGSVGTQDDLGALNPKLRKQLADAGIIEPADVQEAIRDIPEFSSIYRANASITFTSDKKWLLIRQTQLKASTASVWDATTGTPVRGTPPSQLGDVGEPGHSPDGRFLVVPHYVGDKGGPQGGEEEVEQTVTVLNARGKKVHAFHAGDAREVGLTPASSFSYDGAFIAVSGFKLIYGFVMDVPPEIYVFNTTTGKKLVEFGSEVDEQSGPITALAFSGDNKIVAAGYRNKINLFDSSTGQRLQTIPHVGGIAALGFRNEGRLLAALGKDGDTYLFDAHSGELLATLVGAPSESSGEWLVVAPDGKFDGSPGGWNQILWRFGGDTFNVAPVETFFNEFYYPGLLADIIAGKKLRETRDFAQLDRRQPSSQIATMGPSAENVNTRTVQVQVRVVQAQADKDHNAGSGVRDVRLFRNGSLVKAWRGNLPLDSNGQTLLEATIPIVAGANRLTAYAFNHDNIKSADASLVVTGSAALKRAGTAYVVSVGIDQYANPDYNLKFAVADAQDVSDVLAAQQRKVGAVGKVEVVPLLNAEATKANILLALKRLAGTESAGLPQGAPASLQRLQPAQPEDEVFIYFAGPGTATAQRFYIVPHDLGYTGSRTQLDQAGFETIAEHSISDLELETALEKVDARDVLLVIDACNSGQALEAEERRRGPMNSRGLAQLAYEKGMYVLTAAQGYQAALEVKELGHGLLTFALVEEGLKTAAADRSPKDGKVVAREWMDYATMRVPELQEAQIEAAQKQGRELTFVEVAEEMRGQSKTPGLQRPRVFYRREADSEPLIVAKP